jgi:O-antigen/teichoic acid export membrane protein
MASGPRRAGLAKLSRLLPRGTRGAVDRRMLESIVFTYGVQVATIMVAFGWVTLLTRTSGLDGYGRVVSLTALGSVVGALLTFRTNEAVVAFHRRGAVEQDPGLQRLALLGGLVLDASVALVAFAGLALAAPVIAAGLLKDSSAAAAVVIYAASLATTLMRGTGVGLLSSWDRFRAIGVAGLAENLLKVSLLGVASVSGMPVDLELVAWAMLGAASVVTAWMLWLPARELATTLRHASVPRHRIAEYSRFSCSAFASTTLKAGQQGLDTLILGGLSSPATVGLYGLFKQFLAPVQMVSTPFSAQVYPRFVQAVAERRSATIRETIAWVGRLLSVAFAALLCVLVPALWAYLAWNDIVVGHSHWVGFSLMALTALTVQRMWWARPFSMATDPRRSIVGGVIALASTLTLVPAFGAAWELAGVAAAMLATQAILLAYWMRILARST